MLFCIGGSAMLTINVAGGPTLCSGKCTQVNIAAVKLNQCWMNIVKHEFTSHKEQVA